MIKKHLTLKKFLATMAVVWMLSMSGLVLIAHAAGEDGTEPAVAEEQDPDINDIASDQNSTSKDSSVSADELFYRFEYQGDTKTEGTKIGAVNKLPNVGWQKTLTAIIKILLNITGGITLLALTVGGTMMIVSQSNPDLLEKGKKITYYAVAGLVVIAVSYALVIGVSELQFFSGSGDGDSASQESGTSAEEQASPTDGKIEEQGAVESGPKK